MLMYIWFCFVVFVQFAIMYLAFYSRSDPAMMDLEEEPNLSNLYPYPMKIVILLLIMLVIMI